MIEKDKPKLAIIELTDCEGCQVEFFSLKEKLPYLWQKFEIVSWRMAQDFNQLNDIDILLIEGTPLTQEERDYIKTLRKKSKYVGTLGSCAELGGINAILSGRARDQAFKRIYQKNKPTKREVKPLDDIIEIDFRIPGCPIRPDYLAKVLAQLLNDRIPETKSYPVCFDCKLQGNSCILKNGGVCLGPITSGGCQAICPSQNHACFGCFGLIEGAQFESMKRLLIENIGKKETDSILKIFLANQAHNQK